MDYVAQLKLLAQLKAEEEEAEEAAAKAEARRRELEDQIHQQMEIDDVQTIKAGGFSHTRKSTVYATVQDFAKFEAWCEEEGLDDLLIKTTEMRGNLNQLVRDYQNNKQDLPPGVGFRVRNYISTTEN